ncbi:Beta-lactamase [Trichophyton interdigitale]|uniref:Beta-lactamase n=1 Tax=Trichophyton interdigitale TaxID=101480 RepID=A0A9P5CV76_9EURO|nr:Beta-lactamase [Trichophyton interdigitale]KAF3897150.1 Beta-lactamase [Trichophyton interdigitale]KAG8208846.1 Beta-lactamase [Trichophyton interdigitale]
MKISAIALLASVATLLPAVEGYGEWASFHGLEYRTFKAKIDDYIKIKWIPTYISAFTSSHGNISYNFVVENIKGHPAWHTYYEQTTHDYIGYAKERKELGFRLVHTDAHTGVSVNTFDSIWHNNDDDIPWAEHINQSGDEFTKALKDYTKNGYRLKSLSGYGFGHLQQQFASVWVKAPGAPQRVYIGLTAAEYKTKFDQARKDGYYPVKLSPYNYGKEILFAGIFEHLDSNAVKPECQWGLTSDEYVKVFNHWRKKGYKPTVVKGYCDGGDKYAAIFNKFTKV